MKTFHFGRFQNSMRESLERVWNDPKQGFHELKNVRPQPKNQKMCHLKKKWGILGFWHK